jgi:hypothetical protein
MTDPNLAITAVHSKYAHPSPKESYFHSSHLHISFFSTLFHIESHKLLNMFVSRIIPLLALAVLVPAARSGK